jgi:hypothetical protein
MHAYNIAASFFPKMSLSTVEQTQNIIDASLGRSMRCDYFLLLETRLNRALGPE